MTDVAARLGFIYPGGGAEHEYYQFAEAMENSIRVFLIGSRVTGGEDDHAIMALRQTGRIEYIVEAARRLALLLPDVIVWACTSGSFVVGREGAEAQVAAITSATGTPASSTSLAFVRAIDALGLRRIAILATYPREASQVFGSFLGEWNIDVMHIRWLDARSGWDAALLAPEEVMRAALEAAVPEAEALLIPDTAMPTLSLVERLETILGRPVLTANQVTLWEALRLAGSPARVIGHGRLFSHPRRDTG